MTDQPTAEQLPANIPGEPPPAGTEEPYVFHDVVLDDVPYSEMPDTLLIEWAHLGDEAADAELDRRADEQIKKDLEEMQRNQ